MPVTMIKCPSCQAEFELQDSLRKTLEEDIKKEYNERVEQWKKKKEKELEEQIRKTLLPDYENKISLLEKINQEQQQKLNDANKRFTELLKREQELKNKEEELELTVQKRLMQERENLKQVIREQEAKKIEIKETEYQLVIKELQKQLED
ncbi:MAG: hypothetical protein N2747_01060 [Chitinophagaceae bacterium]|nr:hypothetical protein [Chitinophagaceae bacterium]